MKKISKRKPRKRPARRSTNKANSNTKFDLDRLAPELLDTIIRHLDKKDLKTACLVSRTWRSTASQHLFDRVSFLPTRPGVRKWKLITDHKTSFPRKATFFTAPVPHYKYWCSDVEGYEYKLMDKWRPKPNTKKYADFYQAITGLNKWPNLNSAQLHFTPACATDEDNTRYLDEGVEPKGFRLEMLQCFFEALEQRRNDANVSTVKTLTISNLQNMALPEFTTSSLFKSVMQDIEHLHLSIAEECQEEAQDDIFREEKWTFLPYLQQQWLHPISSQLKSLTLYFSRPWGSFPARFESPGVFPRLEFNQLETLTLGNYCFAYDDSVDWILRHKSITSLRLHNCFIPFQLVFEEEWMLKWNVQPLHWRKLPVNGPEDEWRWYDYSGTWETIFDRIRTCLPLLIDFRFHMDPNYAKYRHNFDGATFETPERLTTTLSPRRYIDFDMGLENSPWPDIADSGFLGCIFEDPNAMDPDTDKHKEVNPHKDTYKGDSRAFEDILNTIHERRRGRC